MNKRITFILLVSLSWFSSKILAQCGPANVTQAEYCIGQPAEFIIDDPDPTFEYRWFQNASDENGSFGTSGDFGRTFTSSANQNGDATFRVTPESDLLLNPPLITPNPGVNGEIIANTNTDFFIMPFNTDVDFRLDTVSFIAQLSSASETYEFILRTISTTGGIVDTAFSENFAGMRSEFTDLGTNNLYRIDLPITRDINDPFIISAGDDQAIEIVSSGDNGDTPVDAFFWFNENTFNGDTYFGGDIELLDPVREVEGTDLEPLIFDWDIRILCETQNVETTLGADCCVPVESDFTITSSDEAAISFPVTLTAAGPSIDGLTNHFYEWTDESNTVVDSGIDLRSIDVNQGGLFVVTISQRESENNVVACNAIGAISVGLQNIFTSDDTTVCSGFPLTVTSFGSEITYTWSSDDPIAQAALISPNEQTTEIGFLPPGAYIFNVEGEVLSGNVATDGGFDGFVDNDNFDPTQPNRSFETTYNIPTGANNDINGNNEFRVDDEVLFFGQTPCSDVPDYFLELDPTGMNLVPRGNFIYGDAPSNTNQTPVDIGINNFLWQLSSRPVLQNTDYLFSVDLSNFNGGQAAPDLMLLVNGQPLTNLMVDGTPLADAAAEFYDFPEGVFCEWERLSAVWNSGTANQATITIAEISDESTGHEFAIDNISFSEAPGGVITLETQSDPLFVTIENCNILTARDDTTICIGEPVPLSLIENNGFFNEWTDEEGNVVATDENAEAFLLESGRLIARSLFPTNNLITNGSFNDAGIIEFETDLGTVGTNTKIQNDVFFIGPGISDIINNTDNILQNQPDNTFGTLEGNRLVAFYDVNAGPKTIMRFEIPVIAGETYGLSLFVRHLFDGSTPDLPFEIIVDNNVEGTFELPSQSDWMNLATNWVAQTTGTAVVEFSAPQGVVSFGEGLIGIDDVILAQLGSEEVDDVNITLRPVEDCIMLILTDEDCDGQIRVVSHETDGIFAGWFDQNGDLISADDTLKFEPSETETVFARANVILGPINENGNFDLNTLGNQMTNNQQTFFPVPTDANGQPIRENGFSFAENANEFNIANQGFDLADLPSRSGSGNLLLVNTRSNTLNESLFLSEAISVNAGTIYDLSLSLAFATRATDLSQFPEFFPVDIFVGTELLGSVDLLENNNWQDFSFPYIPATSGNVEINIVLTERTTQNLPSNLNQFLTYAVDEVFLSPTVSAISASIEVEPCSPVAKDTTVTLCSIDAENYELTDLDDFITCAGEDNASTAAGWYRTEQDAIDETNELTLTEIATLSDGDEFFLRTESGMSGGAGVGIVTFEINATPVAPVISDDFDFCLNEDVSGQSITDNVTATGTLTWYDETDASLSTPIAEPGLTTTTVETTTYQVTQTEDECESEASTIDVVVNDNPSLLTVTTPIEYCLGDVSTALSETADGVNTLNWYTVETGGTSSATAPTPSTATAGTESFFVSQTNASGCESARAEIEVIVNALPTGEITGGGTFCQDETPSLTVTLGGATDFDVVFNIGGVDQSALTGVTSPQMIPLSSGGNILVGEYGLTSVTDANGCVQTVFDPAVTVDTIPDLIISNVEPTCDFDTKEATVSFDISGGDAAYTFPTADPTAGILTLSTYSSTFLAEGPTAYEFRVSDGSGCTANTDSLVTANMINCDCPVQGEVRLASGEVSSVCTDSLVTLEVELSNSEAVTPNYTFTLSNATAGITLTELDAEAVNGDIYTFTVGEAGTYSLTLVEDVASCIGSSIGTGVDITIFDRPTAEITGMEEICSDGTDLGQVVITPSTFPTTVVVGRITGADTTITITGASGSITSRVGNEYTIDSLVDGNGCPAETSGLTGTGIITEIEAPVAAITDPLGTLGSPFQFVTAELDLEGTLQDSDDMNLSFGDYTGSWEVVSGQGTVSPDTDVLLTEITGATAVDPEANSTTEISFTVRDINGVCEESTVTTFIRRVSKTTPSLGLDESICEGLGTDFTGDTPIPGLETARWIDLDGNFTGSGANTEIVTGTDLVVPAATVVGTYNFIYEIDNDISGLCSDTISLTVVAQPVAAIINTLGTPLGILDTLLFGTDELDLEGTLQDINGLDLSFGDYTGLWEEVSGQGTISPATDVLLTEITGATAVDPEPNSTTEISFTVGDVGGVCGDSTVTTFIRRVDQTTPEPGLDTTICIDESFIRTGNAIIEDLEDASWIDVDGAIVAAGGIVSDTTFFTIPTGLPVGQYEFEYIIDNNIKGSLSESFTLTVDGLPSAPGFISGETSPIATCVDEEQLIVDESSAIGTGLWTKVSGTGNIVLGEESIGTATVENIEVNASGVYRWKVSNGACEDRDSIDVTIDRQSATSPATITLTDDGTLSELFTTTGSELDLCENIDYNVTGSTIASDEIGTWEIVSGTSITINEDGTLSQDFTPSSAGTTVLRWSIAKTGTLASLCPVDSQDVSLEVFGALDAAITTPAATESICANNEELILETVIDSDNMNAEWREGTVNIDNIVSTVGSNSHTITGEDLGEGTHILTWAVSNDGCPEETASYTIEVDPVETPMVSLELLVPLCEGDPLTINATTENGGLTPSYSWTVDGDAQLGITGDELILSSVSPEMSGSVVVTLTSSLKCVTNNDNTATGTTELIVIEIPSPSIITQPTVICETDSISLEAIDVQVNSTRQWFLDGEALIGETDSVIIRVLESGVYTFTESNTVCTDEVEALEMVEIEVVDLPEIANLSPEGVEVEQGEEIRFTALHTLTGEWSLGVESEVELGDPFNNSSTVVSTNTLRGENMITFEVSNEVCGEVMDSLIFRVTVPIRVPNIFTPNGDGENDVFEILDIETFGEVSVEVFNRYGVAVFSYLGSEYEENEWIGTSEGGGEVPEGAYYYIIEVGAGAEQESGVINLVR